MCCRTDLKYSAFTCTVQHTYIKMVWCRDCWKLQLFQDWHIWFIACHRYLCLSKPIGPLYIFLITAKNDSWWYFLITHNQSAMLCYYIPPKTQGEFIFSAIVHTTLCRWCLSPTWKKTVTQWIEILSKGAILFWSCCVFTRYILGVHISSLLCGKMPHTPPILSQISEKNWST